MSLDKMFFTKREQANLSIKDAYPHRITRVNGYMEFLPFVGCCT